MIRNIFQKMAAAGMMLLPAWMSLATPVTREQACTAAGNWLKTDPGLGCRLGQSVASARTCTTTNGASFHVVRFAGGGFVVMSADTSQHPVLAFSDSSDLVESADNPLWCIVRADISRRAAATAGASRIAKGRRASSAFDASAKWSRLLAPTPKSRAGNGLPTVSDLRVGEILGTKWGQTVNSIYNNYGELCYNMFTPSNYPCGCVATAMGQIMLHHRHPERPKVVARPCRVAGEPVTLSVRGNPYDWTNMKRIPEADSLVSWYDGGATAIERSAIGGLTYDCGVAMCMDWGAPVGDFTTDMRQSASFGAFAFEALTNVFGYANARGYWDGNERVSRCAPADRAAEFRCGTSRHAGHLRP